MYVNRVTNWSLKTQRALKIARLQTSIRDEVEGVYAITPASVKDFGEGPVFNLFLDNVLSSPILHG